MSCSVTHDEGRIYGATFIDHNTKSVLNGSRLGKEPANAPNERFNNPQVQAIPSVTVSPKTTDTEAATHKRHHRTSGEPTSDCRTVTGQPQRQRLLPT